MTNSFNQRRELPPEQEAIRAKCFHPSGKFVEFPKEDVETSIPERFEKIVRRFPDRVAVKMTHETLTYQELSHASNRLAHAILAQRGKKEEPVALLMEHDCPLIVTMMGVLKAGKICVVLDPSFPKARSAFLLEDSQAGLLITDSKNLSVAMEYAHNRCRVLNVDELESGFSLDNPGLLISPDHYAFLVYTSGSTGQPKGVIQNDRNLLHESLVYCNGLRICADDRVALLYSCSASQGLKITFATLLNGATLCGFNVRQKGVAALAAWLRYEEITIYFSIPIVFRQFVSSLTGREQFPYLRIIQLGSDAVTHGEIEEYQKHFSVETILVIRYGTTETGTLRRMFFKVAPAFEETTVPVGYAVEDVEISLLDEEGKEVNSEGIGKIVVESRYISPGYWRRPDLTREKFFPGPNGGDTQIYDTGDLGRLRSDGALCHLGRKDFQLKIRGYTAEASEIEALLLSQENVKEALVAAVKASSGTDSDRLVAYIVPFERPLPSISALRRAARETLPSYMIPSDFVFLESLPRTPNGKIDRLNLPSPDDSRPELGEAFVAARTPTEEVMAGIWAEVLKVKKVSVHDNFFDLGGHSLSATQVMSRVREIFKVEIPLCSLFEHPTIGALAEYMETTGLVSRQNEPKSDQTAREMEEIIL